MSLRTRLALLVALAVAFGVALVAVAAYVTVGTQLRAQLDAGLLGRAEAAVNSPLANPELLVKIPAAALGAGRRARSRRRLRRACRSTPTGGPQPPLGSPSSRWPGNGATSRCGRPPTHAATRCGSRPSRAAVRQRLRPGARAVHGRSCSAPSTGLTLVLVLVGLVGVGLAALAGLAVASAGLRPVERLTQAAEKVEPDRDPRAAGHPGRVRRRTSWRGSRRRSTRCWPRSAESRDRQRRLVADAGHELRTPLTSLRTNLDLLAQSDAAGATGGRTLDPADRDAPAGRRPGPGRGAGRPRRRRRRAGARGPAGVGRGAARPGRGRRARGDPGPSAGAERSPSPCHSETWPMVGDAALLERAVTNVLDNAARWSPADGTSRVSLSDGRLDGDRQGPGIADGDLPHVFDRFYRSPEARSTPGSGLGLAIVRQAAERHGGAVAAGRAPGGGALVTFVVPARSRPSRRLLVGAPTLSIRLAWFSGWSQHPTRSSMHDRNHVEPHPQPQPRRDSRSHGADPRPPRDHVDCLRHLRPPLPSAPRRASRSPWQQAC